MFNATIPRRLPDVFPRSRSISLHTEAAGSAPPDAFGPFRVLHQIGAGALGPVFRAYDPDQDRLVAVKLFRLDLRPEQVHQLVAELDRVIAADLTHAAIAAPIAAGIVGASAYLAQDFVAADALDTVVREHGAAPVGEAIRVVTQLAGALDYAAVVNILHGTLHPRDVLISPDDVRLTGLGVARALEKVGVQVPVRRPFSAPERAAGGQWDRRADIFGLAVLAHELFWGRRLTATGADAAAALAGLPGARLDELRAVFARALADDPAQRFRTALEFADALKNCFSVQVDDSRQSIVDSRQSTVDSRPSTVGSRQAAVEPMLPLVRSDDEAAGTKAADAVARENAADAPISGDDRRDAAVILPVTAREDERQPMADDLALRTAEDARFTDVETAPSIPPGELPGAVVEATPAAAGPSSEVADVVEPPQVAVEPPLTIVEPPPAAVVPPAARRAETPAPARATIAEASVPIPIVHPPQAAASDAHLGPARSAVWPLSLALVVGLAVGFAGGYALGRSERENGQSLAVAERTDRVTPASTETEVKLPAGAQPASSAAAPASAPAAAAPPEVVPRAVEPAPAPPKPAPPPPAPASAGRITVRSTPTGARVLIDGRDSGRTPVTVRNLARGTHTVRVMRDGYATEERRVSVTQERPNPTVTVQLARAAAPAASAARTASTASLLVESRPTGATVFLDGKRIGTTPMSIAAVAIGAHVVRLELAKHKPWSASVRVVAGEKNRVAASLER